MADAKQNQHIEAALDYHESTKHSEESLQADPHFLDFDNQPLPFKIYTGRGVCSSHTRSGDSRPRDAAGPGCNLAARQPCNRGDGREITRPCDALSGSVSGCGHYQAQAPRRWGGLFPRLSQYGGALYHIDLYVVTGDLPDLPAGVYHFGPHDFSLYRLRAGDYRAVLVAASGRHPSITRAPVTLVSASTYWRKRVEISGPRVSPLLLGQRHAPRESACRCRSAGSGIEHRNGILRCRC